MHLASLFNIISEIYLPCCIISSSLIRIAYAVFYCINKLHFIYPFTIEDLFLGCACGQGCCLGLVVSVHGDVCMCVHVSGCVCACVHQ